LLNDEEPEFCCGKSGFAENPLWYWFEAPAESARITTCHTPDGPDQDSLLQVFRPGDPSSLETACQSLERRLDRRGLMGYTS
jgi:hypothetical protein